MDILIKPILTEKATDESELRNSYTFIVSKDAKRFRSKKQLKNHMEYLYLKLEL